MRLVAILGAATIVSTQALAGPAEVVDARAVRSPDGSWRFDVTVRHDDTGWQHYANAWQVLGADGTILATRELLHPHVDEQPFTRSKSGIAIPEGTRRLFVRAGDSVHGFEGKMFEVKLAP